MSYEYLAFDLLVWIGPFVLGFFGPTFFRGRSMRAWLAVMAAALPFLVWDIAVAGEHWQFSEAYTLGPSLWGLPLEEWLFFAVVPYALVFSWEILLGAGHGERRPGRAWVYLLFATGLPLGVWALLEGKGYTGLTAIALALVAAYDWFSGAKVATHTRAWAFVALVVGTTVIFDGYLTSRPVVTYGEAYQLGVRIGTIPVEDFGYGLASGWLAVAIYTWIGQPNVLDQFIERRFGGYRHEVVAPDPAQPLAWASRDGATRPRVAVIGSGIAGLRAASLLAQRGLSVQVFEKNEYMGGKIGAWTVRDGETDLHVEHGFHAFFRHYYNLDDFLHEAGVRSDFAEIDDYAILGNDGRRHGFAGIRDAPVLNLLSLLGKGMFTLGDVALNPKTHQMQAFVEYEKGPTYARWDEVSFETFAKDIDLPANLRLVFNSFSRAFFAPGHKMSMGELIKSFHFYFLGHDKGLIYDYPTEDYQESLLAPLREHLEGAGAQIYLGRPVGELRPTEDGAIEVDGERFDHVVMAADVVGTRRILEASPALLAQTPRLAGQLASLRPSNRYAVLRVWADRRAGEDLPVFSITESYGLLDSISFYHRIESHAREWAEARGGAVYELHAYAIPDDFAAELSDPGEIRAAVRARLLEEFYRYLPELEGMQIEHEVLQLEQNFTALHVGMHATRPATETEHPALTLAGDWVDLPYPAMLMEAACTSGILAANAILEGHGLRAAPVASIPLRGLLAPSRMGKGAPANTQGPRAGGGGLRREAEAGRVAAGSSARGREIASGVEDPAPANAARLRAPVG